jgi:hypothetical protein
MIHHWSAASIKWGQARRLSYAAAATGRIPKSLYPMAARLIINSPSSV